LNKILFIIIVLISTILLGSSKSDYKKLSKRYHSAKVKDWRVLKDDFLKHANKYSKEKIAAKSYYTSANLSFKLYKRSKKKKDLNFAIKYFDKVCKNYKVSLSDDACLVLYTIHFQFKKDKKKSIYYAKYIIDHYKKSDSYRKAVDFLKRRYPSTLKKNTSTTLSNRKKKNTSTTLSDRKKKNTSTTLGDRKKKNTSTTLGDRKKKNTVTTLSDQKKKNTSTTLSDRKKKNTSTTLGDRKKKNKKFVIILDPGHGGYDPGAVGTTKKSEKDIVLAVALKLEKKLKKNKKYKVILTRRKDKFLSLDARTDVANHNNGDLFISIHINALKAKKYYGIETFYLNLAADNYSKRLERVENAEAQKKISDLQFILADLLKKANTKDSINFAKTIQSSLVFNLRRKYKNIRDLGVKNAMFYVLLDTKMPSILVELGFITNKKEEKKLNNKKYQDLLATSLKKGIDNYFSKHKKGK